MKSINIRCLKHETSAVLGRVASGESLEIRRRDKPLAILKPLDAGNPRKSRPDFRQRLRDAYGEAILGKTATDLLNEERGDR